MNNENPVAPLTGGGWRPPVGLSDKWLEVSAPGFGQQAWRRADGLQVICSSDIEGDGHPWLHVSVSRKMQLPDYQDLCQVKKAFVGKRAKALMVFAPEDEHINDHPYCLHLFSRLDGDSLPDFRREVDGVKLL
jgi:hypothetical protein